MKETPYILDYKDDDNPLSLNEVVLKYLRYWPWFLVSCVLFSSLGYFYEQYASKTYISDAKIKIIDDIQEAKIIPKNIQKSDNNLGPNLENYIEVLTSNKLLLEVVNDLDLDIDYFQHNAFSYHKIWNPPFKIKKNIEDIRLNKALEYEIVLKTEGYKITSQSGNIFFLPYNTATEAINDYLPFSINLADITNFKTVKEEKYKVVLKRKQKAAEGLSKELKIKTSEKDSDAITLAINGQSKDRSEAILDAIIQKLEFYDITDKRAISKRTLEVIDERFKKLSTELDSIEAKKEIYKKLEDLSYIQSDAGTSLQRKSVSVNDVLQLETQISLLKLLQKSVSSSKDYTMLPADIGLSNIALNGLVEKFNEMAKERQKLSFSVESNHPSLVNLSQQIELAKKNIFKTISVYESQLSLSLKQLNEERSRADISYSKIPEKERILRSIERQQSIKENLYLLLLSKREEAAIDYESTTSSIKIIDYGLSSLQPLWPKKTVIYPFSLLIGLVIPFLFIYFESSFDTKIHDRSDIESINPEIPTLIEIPNFGAEKSFISVNDRSPLAESFRILSTNTDFLLKSEIVDGGKVVFVTSSIKAEGKTLIAVNLSLAYASMGKKVLLVGSDLRNPQLHTHTNLDKNTLGLSDFLENSWFSFHEGIQKGFNNDPNHKIYPSGAIPKSAPALLSGNRFVEFIKMAKKDFDYVIVDTAPTMLVTDTLLISKHADATLFVVRSGYTDKKLLRYSKELNKNKKLRNTAYVLNAFGSIKDGKYNYGYAYGYEEKVKKTKFSEVFSRKDETV